ncbi:MAG: DEAD/DEAH box helicase, partial [Actinomycetota bacterium]
MTDSPLAAFHPVVRAWFAEKFPTGPTAPQEAAWPEIPRGRDVLVASPTGSGKTLTAFLVAINEMWVNPPAEKLLGPRVVYLSPLRALATDVQQNLLQPLAELKALGERMGYAAPDIRVDVRTGDTSSSERASQKRRPAHIYVTTPETFYLLLTTKHGRTMMRQVETIIIDEIHTMCRDKRGSHLTLSLERLERLCSESSRPRPQRIGLSATQRPLDLVASMLSGVG